MSVKQPETNGNIENVEEYKEEEDQMFAQNGNRYASAHFGYLPYRYLPYASTSTTQTAADAVVGSSRLDENDLSNIPKSIIVELEKSQRTIAAQKLEIERLKSFQNQNVESKVLRQQLGEMEKEIRNNRERFLEQQELLAEMSREMDNLLRDKLHMQAQLHEMEKKYKKAKYASRELAKILENDVCSTSKISNGFESDNEEEKNESLFQRSRALSRQLEQKELEEKLGRIEERKRAEAERESREMMEKVIIDNENLLMELEKERRMSTSLQDDLEKNRRIILDRDEKIEELKMKLSKAENRTAQCETDLSRTSTDLALERARCDALSLELHELDGLFSQSQSTIQTFAIENENLEEKYRHAQHTIVSLNAKLEAQGIDLVKTKKALRECSEKLRSGEL